MDDPGAVRLAESAGDFNGEPQGVVDLQRPGEQAECERLAFDVFENQVVRAILLTDVVERADVRMRERRDGLRFTRESGPEVRIGARKDLDRNGAFQPRVARLVDLTETAVSERRENLVRADATAGDHA